MLSSPVSMRVVLERHEKKFGKRPESNTERAENKENKENRLAKMGSIISSIKRAIQLKTRKNYGICLIS